MGVFDRAAAGELIWGYDVERGSSNLSSANALRNGAMALRELASCGEGSSGVMGLEPNPLSSEPEIGLLFVSAIENKLKGSSVRPNSCDAENGDCECCKPYCLSWPN